MFVIPHQVFSWSDAPLILLLILLEIVLSGDNATLLSMLIRRLSHKQQGKALFIGVFSAFILRFIGILLAAVLIQLFWVKMIGGLYLLYIAIKHFYKKHTAEMQAVPSFWLTVVKIEIVDILFAIDSILAAFALTSIYYPSTQVSGKIWVIYVGGLLGMLTIRSLARVFTKILLKYQYLEKLIFLLIGWMGLKLFVEGIFYFFPNSRYEYLFDFIFWIGSILIFIIGVLLLSKKEKKSTDEVDHGKEKET